MMAGTTPPPERPGLEAELSCGDVVTAWDEPRRSELHPEVETVPCTGCRGTWRRVVEIRERDGPSLLPRLLRGEKARVRARGVVPGADRVVQVEARPADGTTVLRYSDHRSPYVLPAIMAAVG